MRMRRSGRGTLRRALCAGLLAVALTAQCALAETVIDGRTDRGITPAPSAPRAMEPGVSPTTGRALSDLEVPEGFAGYAATGRYMPMLVQIDNTNGGVGSTAPWGVAWADIVYETPLHQAGYTRLSALFSDVIPTAVGPVRSARVGHVWLRQEWNCGFMYYGGQTRKGSSIKTEFSKLKAKSGVVLFNGTDGQGKPWKKFYTKRKGTVAPHNRSGNAAAISALIPASHTAAQRSFLFTDMPHEGDPAQEVSITWGAKGYGSTLVYLEGAGEYARYMRQADGSLEPWVDADTGEQVLFDNVIIQYTNIRYNDSEDAPVPTLTGHGNADVFQGGMHIAGMWQRKDMQSPTVFYDGEGKEIPLLRGRTLVVQLPFAKEVSYR